MKLSPDNTQQFFKIMLDLLYYTNQQRSVIKRVKSKDDFLKLSTKKKFEIRNVLWQNPSLIDDFARENPENLADEDLSILLGWKKFVKGTFFIFRQLKKHAILIKDEEVYAVMGLYSSLHEAIHDFPLPAMVDAVLLPFKGQIVYDGLMTTRNVFFGGGIKASLTEAYERAKIRNQIIASFEPTVITKTTAPPADLRTWAALLDQMEAQTAKMKGGNDLQDAAFAFLKASIGVAKAASTEPVNFEAVAASEKKIRRAYNKLDKILSYLAEE
jgi:hypothetical protein